MALCSQERMASVIIHKQLKLASAVIAFLDKFLSVLHTFTR